MQIRNLIRIMILLGIVFCGCSHQNNSAIHFARNSTNRGQTQFESLPDKTNTNVAPATQPDELTGNITLRDAVAFALINNPKLRAFSLDIRSAEAQKLQAGLLPNPEIDVEVEEVGGTGERGVSERRADIGAGVPKRNVVSSDPQLNTACFRRHQPREFAGDKSIGRTPAIAEPRGSRAYCALRRHDATPALGALTARVSQDSRVAAARSLLQLR